MASPAIHPPSTAQQGCGFKDFAASHGWKNAFLDQFFAEFDAERSVDIKYGDGDAANWRAADEDATLPAEMTCPFVASRVEQPGELARLWVTPANIRTFE